MPRNAILTLTLLTAIACLVIYSIDSAPVALAKSRANQQDALAPPPLPTPPATWTVTSTGATGAVKAAGGSGVQHVATCVAATFFVTPSSSSAEGNTVTLLDGSCTSGTALLRWEGYAAPGTTFSINQCDLNVVGTANNAMSLCWLGTQPNAGQTVSLVGYDAN
ncbi:MAG TPA: hypothetical protein VJQ59_17940 [Candidatus Sulfotelmatobacter sp.]|nr:hypothetical protein [Candidatus Sulfotelmatobacter sp.]